MYFTTLIWNHFHVFHKINIENTFMFFHLGRSPIRIRPTEKSVYFSTLPSFFFTKLTMQSQKKMNFPKPLHRKHCKEGATVVTQFRIHQDFLKCYFISIIYKNPKKLRKRKIQKIYFFRVNRIFPSKPSPPGQYGSNHVDQGKKWVSGRFGSKPSLLTKTEFTESIRVKPCRPG
jgi:hypothetical protein